MQMLAPLALAALMLVALPGPVAAQDKTEPECPEGYSASPEGCTRNAWVEDCPPDMMCAAGAGENGTDEPTYGDCGGEVCAYDGNGTYGCGPRDTYCADTPQQFGPDGCIDCMAPVDGNQTGTCMDGAQPGEACDDDVQYIGGPGRGPADCENCRGDDAAPQPAAEGADAGDGKDAPGLGVALFALGMLAIAGLMRVRRE